MDYIIYSILFLVMLRTLRGKPLIKKIPPTASTSLGDAVESKEDQKNKN